MTTTSCKTPIIANCDAKSDPKKNDCEVEEVNAAAGASAHLIELKLKYLRKEHTIKMKAIADREAAQLLFARREYYLLRSGLIGSETDADDDIDVANDDGDGITVDDNVISHRDHVSPPNSFEYAPSNCSSPALVVSPTPQQVNARQVMTADLPVFSGDPEEWPVFYSQFKNTTMACGYSDSENLIRLQRCLKGQALEYVRSRLLLPSLVPKVMDTLKMLYGRPTVIIGSLIKKVRAVPSPEMERLETIINYGMAIQNLVDHLIAMEQTAHLRNPTLLQELIGKLPGEMKLQWAQYKRTRESSSLEVLCDFMNELVQDACEVTNVGSVAALRMEEFSENESFENTNRMPRNTARKCLVCRNQQHHVQDCDEFNSFDVSRRWRVVGELRLCRCCLNRRHATGVCQNAEECGIERCQLLHHPLLHQNRVQEGHH